MDKRATNTLKQNEYQKPVIFIDEKPIKDTEALIEECEQLIAVVREQSNSNEYSGTFSRFQKMRWRNPKVSSGTVTLNFEKLQPKIQDAEKVLRGMLLGIIEKKSALKIQAKYLVNRLQACILHQNNQLEIAESPVAELRNLVNDLANESSAVKMMVFFNNEVLRQKNVQAVRQGKSYVPWNKKKNSNVLSEEELSKDPDYPALHHRLHQLRSVREQVVEHLSRLLEKKEMISVNLDSSLSVKLQLQALLKSDSKDNHEEKQNSNSNGYSSLQESRESRDSKDSKDSDLNQKESGENKDSKDIKEISNNAEVVPGVGWLDHSRCSDCLSSQSLAADCLDHLQLLETQSMRASRALMMLVETRERVRDYFNMAMADNEDLNNMNNLNNLNSSTHSQNSNNNFWSTSSHDSPRNFATALTNFATSYITSVQTLSFTSSSNSNKDNTTSNNSNLNSNNNNNFKTNNTVSPLISKNDQNNHKSTNTNTNNANNYKVKEEFKDEKININNNSLPPLPLSQLTENNIKKHTKEISKDNEINNQNETNKKANKNKNNKNRSRSKDSSNSSNSRSSNNSTNNLNKNNLSDNLNIINESDDSINENNNENNNDDILVELVQQLGETYINKINNNQNEIHNNDNFESIKSDETKESKESKESSNINSNSSKRIEKEQEFLLKENMEIKNNSILLTEAIEQTN